MRFIKNVRSAKINTRLDGNQLTVLTQPVEWATHYACYLYVNGKTVITCGYQPKQEFVFDLSPYALDDQIKVRYYFYNREVDQRGGQSVDITKKRLSLWVLHAEKSRLLNKQITILGEALVKEKKLQLGPFPSYLITEGFSFWEEDPFKNRSWQWRVHWFEFIYQLLAYFQYSKDNNALMLSQKSIESWWDSYWGKPSNFEFIKHDHATALRAEVLLTYYCYVAEHAPSYFSSHKVFFENLYQFLLELKTQLLDPLFYSEHTNHGLEQARVLLLLGTYFQDRGAQQVAVERISSELEFSFTEEGVHKENSPGYHQFVLKVFLNIIGRFPKDILGDLAKQFDDIGVKALGFLAHIIRPDGYLPIIGDTELIKPSDSYSKYFKNDVEYQEYLYSSSLGRKGKKPRDNFKVYEKSGYAIYRNQWGNRNNFNQTVQLILKAGCLSQYHHQQDEGNVLLYAYGEDWLIDSGLYNYINSDPIRKYMRSRLAHNVPVISEGQYHKNFDHRLRNWQLSNAESQHKLRIEASHQVLLGIDCQRSIIIDNRDSNKELFSFVIEDSIKSVDKKSRDITFYWHVPKDKKIICHDDKVKISSKSGSVMTMRFSPRPISIQLEKGIIEGKVVSCTSTNFGTYQDSQLVKVTYTTDDFLFISTEFALKQYKDH